ncbi:MAG TPA: hypothetical protein VKU61_13875 [Candidatus Binatia bacterium]|nr:hypothetical protein [Candidatus Binatia bacterium]
MARVTAVGGGFLLAVLWMDLMFDVQAWRLGAGPAADAAVVASIATYYHRVTTDAFPMNRLIGLVMLVTLVAASWRVWSARRRRGLHATAFALAAGPIVLAAVRVFPAAVRLGSAVDAVPAQAALARAILRDHLACLVAILGFTGIQVWLRDDPAP